MTDLNDEASSLRFDREVLEELVDYLGSHLRQAIFDAHVEAARVRGGLGPQSRSVNCVGIGGHRALCEAVVHGSFTRAAP